VSKRSFDDIETYMREDHAATVKMDTGGHHWDPAEVDSYMEAVEENGYVIVDGLLTDAQCEEIRASVTPLLEHCGRNTFEGEQTQRLYSVIEKTLALNPLVEHPLVLSLLDRVLDPNYLLSQLQVINILPGEAAQLIHHDDGFYRVPRPRPALGAAVIVPIDPFLPENGATRVLPGSHAWDDHVPTAAEQANAVPATMAPGSMLFFLGTLWHGGSANRTEAPRMCVTAQYCEPWCRQQENFSLSVSRDRARVCSPAVQRLLGYSIHPPFMGFVDGRHPIRLLK